MVAAGVTRLRGVLADDHDLVRSGIRALLERHDVEIVGEASDGETALRLVARHQPDIVLMDISMPGMSGLEATFRIAHEFPRVKVIMLSVHTNEEYVRSALAAGAAGYLLKNAAPAELQLAVQAAARGERYLSPRLTRHAGGDAVLGEPATLPGNRLTSRQRDVLRLVAEGCTTKEIAARLGLGVRTIDTHRARLMERLDIHDIAGLVRYAIHTGLMSRDR
jgi:DNA-binding NarL/FixJ family response regulator